MKTTLIILILVGLTSMTLSRSREKNSVRGDIVWGWGCGGSGHLVYPMQMKGCNSQKDCTLFVGQTYTFAAPSIFLANDYTDLNFELKAIKGTSEEVTLVSQSKSGSFLTNHTTIFLASFTVNNQFTTAEEWTMQVTVKDANDPDDLVLCHQFDATINGTTIKGI